MMLWVVVVVVFCGDSGECSGGGAGRDEVLKDTYSTINFFAHSFLGWLW
jgi:hypothetical protein